MPRRAFVAALLLFVAGVVGAVGIDKPQPARRIVSLAPNLTELAFDAGAGDRVVGADSMSDYPAEARKIQRIGDAFQVDYERVLALKPDVVLVWVSGTSEPVIERLQRLKLRVERIEISGLQDVASALRRIGEIAGTSAVAERAAVAYLNELARLRASRQQVKPVSVFYEISVNPLYTVNGRHSISEIIELCGGHNVFADLGPLAPAVSVEAVLARDPQVILAGTGAQGDPLAIWKRWPQLRAVRDKHLYMVDADQLARATPRIVNGAREVCSVLDKVRQTS